MKKTLVFAGFILLLGCNIQPTNLSGKVETIELSYVGWACDCADWATTENIKKFNGRNQDSLEANSVFIEAENEEVKIPEELKNPCCGNKIRFTGQFYLDKGISIDYEQQFKKPDKAKVFRYSSYEIVKPYTAWDFKKTGPKPLTKIIK